jgi:hypothetical protein
MMALFGLVVLLVFFVWLGIVVDRRLDAQRRGEEAAMKMRVQRFRAWGNSVFAGQHALHRWLAQLPDKALRAMLERLLELCADLGFSLDWVLEKRIVDDAMLAARLEDIVAQYVKSCYDAYISQEDIRCFEAWLGYNAMPYGKEQRALAERLLKQLIDVGVSPTAAQSLLVAPDTERVAYIHQAVREASEKDPRAFRSVLKNVLATPVAPVAEGSPRAAASPRAEGSPRAEAAMANGRARPS